MGPRIKDSGTDLDNIYAIRPTPDPPVVVFRVMLDPSTINRDWTPLVRSELVFRFDGVGEAFGLGHQGAVVAVAGDSNRFQGQCSGAQA